jgi:hypothetical protein
MLNTSIKGCVIIWAKLIVTLNAQQRVKDSNEKSFFYWLFKEKKIVTYSLTLLGARPTTIYWL